MGGDGDAFGLFVSCVPGNPVTRHGTKILIGADRDPNDRRKIRYREKQIVAIPHGEALKYAREYRRSIADGSLVEHTKEQWLAQQRHIEQAEASRGKLAGESPEGKHGSNQSSR